MYAVETSIYEHLMKPDHPFVQEREADILRILEEKRRTTVSELAQTFGVSESTVRRHLNALGKRGEVLRTHGGALSLAEAKFEDSLDHKISANIVEKRAIARAARERIHDGDTVILGGGTTVLELARLLRDLRGSTVLTDSVLVAAELYSNSGIDLCLCGGTIRDRTGVIVGPEAIQYFSSIRADKTFVGADSMSIEQGITTPNSLEAQIERTLIERSNIAYVLADHSKIGRISVSRQCSLDEIDVLITDSGADRSFVTRARQLKLDVVVCDS
jgi:DeoR family fructose operon transcriptional repressor